MLGYIVGFDFFGTGIGNLTYSLAFFIGISYKSGIYAESYCNVAELENLQMNFDAGFTYLVQDNLQLDVSAGTGLNHKMNYVSVGCSINIGMKNKKVQ